MKYPTHQETMDYLVDDSDPFEEVARFELKCVFHHFMSHILTIREQQVLEMRFGIGKFKEHTLKEVGKYWSVTTERARQIERRAMRKLKGNKILGMIMNHHIGNDYCENIDIGKK